MRWSVKQGPKVGDIRVRKCLALVPTQIGQQWVWLESFWVSERYCDGQCRMPGCQGCRGWEIVENSLDGKWDRPPQPDAVEGIPHSSIHDSSRGA